MTQAQRPYAPSDAGRRAVGPAKSAASMFAIIAALASFFFSFRGQELIALLLAVLAIGAGLVGGVKALSPRVTGGLLSLSAVGLGVLAILVAAIALVL